MPGAILAKCQKSNALGMFHRHRLVVAHPGVGVSTHKYTREHSADHELVDHFSVEDLVSFEKGSDSVFTLGVQGHGAGVSLKRFRIAESEDADVFALLLCALEALAAHRVAPAAPPSPPRSRAQSAAHSAGASVEAAVEPDSSSDEELDDVARAQADADAEEPPSAGAARPRRAAAPDSAFALQAWLSGMHVAPLKECVEQRAVALPFVDCAAFVAALRSATARVAAGGDDATIASDTVVEAASLLFADIVAAAALSPGGAPRAGEGVGASARVGADERAPATGAVEMGGDSTVSVAAVIAALAVLCQGDDPEAQPVFDAFAAERALHMEQADMVRFLQSALPLLGWPLIAGGDISSRAAAIAARVCAGADPDAGVSRVAFASWFADERRSALGAALATSRNESAALKKLVATQQKLSATLAASAFAAQKARTQLQAELDEAAEAHRAMREHVTALLAKIAEDPAPMIPDADAAEAAPNAPANAPARAEKYVADVLAASVGLSIAAVKVEGIRRIVVKTVQEQSEAAAQGVAKGDIIVAANSDSGVAGIVAAMKCTERPLRLTLQRAMTAETAAAPPAESGELAALAADLGVERAARALAEAKAAEALALAGSAAEEARQATAACEAHDAALNITRATLAQRDDELAAALARAPLTEASGAAAGREWVGGPPSDTLGASTSSSATGSTPAIAASQPDGAPGGAIGSTPPSSPAWKALVGGVAGLDAQIEQQSASRAAVQDTLVRKYKALEARNVALEARVIELEADHGAAKAEAGEHAEKYFAQARASAKAKVAMEEQHLKLSGALEARDAALANVESDLRRAARRESSLAQQHADDVRRVTLRHEASLPSLRATLATCATTDSALEELSIELHETSKNSRHCAERRALFEELDSALFAERTLFHRIFGDKRVAVSESGKV
jgi:hypothetical protein